MLASLVSIYQRFVIVGYAFYDYLQFIRFLSNDDHLAIMHDECLKIYDETYVNDTIGRLTHT
jgi:hypothetical protein